MHIRTREDLINWLEDNAGWPSIRRAMLEGTCENFGLFTIGTGRIIVKITSKFKKVWYIQIAEIKLSALHTYGTIIIEKVPWYNWAGGQPGNKLYQGDNPKLYKELKNEDKNLHKLQNK